MPALSQPFPTGKVVITMIWGDRLDLRPVDDLFQGIALGLTWARRWGDPLLPDHLAQITLCTVSLAIAVFAAAVLLGDRDLRKPGWGLALFLGVAAFDSLVSLIGYWDLYPRFLVIGALEPVVISLYGPAIYLYIRHVSGRPPSARATVLMLSGPVLLASVPVMLASTLPLQIKVDMLAGAPLPQSADATMARTLMITMQTSFLIVTFGFLVACWRALDQNLRTLGALFSSIEDRTLSWVRVVVVLIFFAWAWAAIQGPLEDWTPMTGWLAAVDAAIPLSWVALLAFFGIRQRPVLLESPSSAGLTLAEPPEGGEKYARSALDPPRMQKLATRMVQLMTDEALHRDPALSLRRLSDRVGASPNYVSQTLNDHLGVSFFDFVNRFRVEDAERLLRDTDASATEIALEVGFNSRSTFNAAVRKHRGMSPTEIRRRG